MRRSLQALAEAALAGSSVDNDDRAVLEEIRRALGE